MNKLIIIIIAVAIIVGGGAFYGGMKYAESKSPRGRLSQADFQNLQNLSLEEREQRLQQLGANAGGFRGGSGRGQRSGSGSVAGEIISKDDKSITVKLRDGGSKIVFFSDSTEVLKSASGNINDLEINKNVSINGDANSDGSINAKTIQLRPQSKN